MERTYNIPLRSEWLRVPIYDRSKRASMAVKKFLARHMKTDIENVRVGKWLNQEILKRGRRSPPHHVKVNAVKEGLIVRAELKELPKQALEENKKEEERKKEVEEKKQEKKEEHKEEKKEEKTEEDAEKEKILKKEVQHEKPVVQQHIKQQKVPLKRKALQK